MAPRHMMAGGLLIGETHPAGVGGGGGGHGGGVGGGHMGGLGGHVGGVSVGHVGSVGVSHVGSIGGHVGHMGGGGGHGGWHGGGGHHHGGHHYGGAGHRGSFGGGGWWYGPWDVWPYYQTAWWETDDGILQFLSNAGMSCRIWSSLPISSLNNPMLRSKMDILGEAGVAGGADRASAMGAIDVYCVSRVASPAGTGFNIAVGKTVSPTYNLDPASNVASPKRAAPAPYVSYSTVYTQPATPAPMAIPYGQWWSSNEGIASFLLKSSLTCAQWLNLASRRILTHTVVGTAREDMDMATAAVDAYCRTRAAGATAIEHASLSIAPIRKRVLRAAGCGAFGPSLR